MAWRCVWYLGVFFFFVPFGLAQLELPFGFGCPSAKDIFEPPPFESDRAEKEEAQRACSPRGLGLDGFRKASDLLWETPPAICWGARVDVCQFSGPLAREDSEMAVCKVRISESKRPTK